MDHSHETHPQTLSLDYRSYSHDPDDQIAEAAPDASTDPRIDPQIRSFLADIDKDSSPFGELPQPKPQQILTELQSKTPVDMSGDHDRANHHGGWAHR